MFLLSYKLYYIFISNYYQQRFGIIVLHSSVKTIKEEKQTCNNHKIYYYCPIFISNLCWCSLFLHVDLCCYLVYFYFCLKHCILYFSQDMSPSYTFCSRVSENILISTPVLKYSSAEYRTYFTFYVFEED